MAIRLKSDTYQVVLPTNAEVKQWLPGDNVYDEDLFIPGNMPAGSYAVEVAIVDTWKHEPRVNLAIEGRQEDGWYKLGQIKLVK